MPRKELSRSERILILNLHIKQKKSYSEISKMLSRSRSTIQSVLSRYKNEGRIDNKQRCGRPSKLSSRDIRIIKHQIDKNPFLSAPQLSNSFAKHHGKSVSSQTIRRAIRRTGYFARTPRKKPFINLVNRKKRVAFALRYLNEPPEFWKMVIFSDESKFNIFGSDGRIKVWRRKGDALNPKCTIKTIKHGGGGLMVWGCMAASGVGKLKIIENTMDQFVYMDILKENLKASAEVMGIANNYYFQQDNDPKHTAHNVKMWLAYNTPHLLLTPPQSPDLNPIEHLWDHLERALRQHEIRSKQQLKATLESEWQKIQREVTENLVLSMPKRLQAVLKMKGYPTQY